VPLIQDAHGGSDAQPGVLIYLSVFRELAGSQWLPRRTPLGFVYSPLRTRYLIRGTLGQGPQDIDFALYIEQVASDLHHPLASSSNSDHRHFRRIWFWHTTR
jgi:CHASE1-domain containing sensor protein